MPTDAEQLATIKSQTLALLVDLTANPKPSYNIDGQQILWGDYFAKLTDKLEKIDALIAAEAGPFEIETRATT
jgi:hypothetical protein